MRALELLAMQAARVAWRKVRLNDITGSWMSAIEPLTAIVSAVQLRAATEGAFYGADALSQQGLYEAPKAFVDPRGFAGFAADGRTLEGLLYSPVVGVKKLIAGGMAPGQALRSGTVLLDRAVQTTISDTGRSAASVDVAARPSVGYVRMLSAPSCARCVVLAGKFYRWNAGFLRHPKCDCRHVPSRESVAGDATTDPYEYFKSLSPEDQDKAFTKAGAQAVRDGADMFQVVNSRRGLKYAGISEDGTSRGQAVKGAFTLEGTTARANFGKAKRLTPEAIYRLNGDNRVAALADLEKYGYVLPGGQNPLGSLRGQREGFGQLGHGGAYDAARQRIFNARINGRDASDRYTMTAAERRLNDARERWEVVQQGRNPFSAPSMTERAKRLEQPLTPAIAAAVEKDYRRWLLTGGQIFQ
jgi:hypothetical protein